jgi:hypothetical protein
MLLGFGKGQAGADMRMGLLLATRWTALLRSAGRVARVSWVAVLRLSQRHVRGSSSPVYPIACNTRQFNAYLLTASQMGDLVAFGVPQVRAYRMCARGPNTS